jgi:hypothetical protein
VEGTVKVRCGTVEYIVRINRKLGKFLKVCSFLSPWCIINFRENFIVYIEPGVFNVENLKGKLVKIQRGPATVNGSVLQDATVHIVVWEGTVSL